MLLVPWFSREAIRASAVEYPLHERVDNPSLDASDRRDGPGVRQRHQGGADVRFNRLSSAFPSRTKILLASAGLLLAVSGCADRVLSTDHLRSNTAMIFGQPESVVVISDRRYDGLDNTYYRAVVAGRAYQCNTSGRGMLESGIIGAPQCLRQ